MSVTQDILYQVFVLIMDHFASDSYARNWVTIFFHAAK